MVWFLYGLVLGAWLMRVGVWVDEGKLIVGWYVWLIGLAAIALGTLAVQHFFASRKELELRAAWVGLLLLGLPALCLGALACLTIKFP